LNRDDIEEWRFGQLRASAAEVIDDVKFEPVSRSR
jgi:hypothetical protein